MAMEEQDEELGRSEAEEAFEDLRAEVRVLRQAVEDLPKAWAANRPANYTETLGQIVKELKTVSGQLAAIEGHPAIRMAPQQYQAAIGNAGERLLQDAALKFDRAAAAAAQERQALEGLIGSVRGQRQQFEWLAWTGAAALLVGLLISPFAARMLPFGWDAGVAASIVHTDRWNAGIALMKSTNPEGWNTLASEMNLVEPNHAALTACREAAARTKKEQHCTVVVPAPTP
jgi:hypothetical protein